MARIGRLIGAALGAGIGFLAAPLTGGASLAIATGALSGGLIGHSADESRRANRIARAAANEQLAFDRSERSRLASERARIEAQTDRERRRVEAGLARSLRRRLRGPGFQESANAGQSEVLG